MLKKTKGFSLLEAVVALFVLSMITLTFLNSTSIFVSSQKNFVEKNKYDQIADLILQDMMEYRKKVSNPYGSITADAQTFTTNDKTLSVSNVSTMPKVGDILIIDNLSKRFTVESIAGTTPDSVTITTEENLPVTTITSSNITFIAFKKDDLSCFDGLDLTGSVPSSLTNCPSLPSEVTNLFNHWKSIIDNELGSTVTTRTIDVADDGLVTVTLGDGTENVSLAKKINLCIFNNAPTSVAFTFPGLTNPITTGIISHDENPTAHYYANGIARKFGSLTADSSETDDSTSSDCDRVQYSTCRQAYAWEDTISVFLYRYTGPDVRVKPSACDSATSWQCPGVRINQNDLSLWFIFDEFNYEDDSVDSTWVDQNVSGWNEGGYLRYTTSNLPANARVLVFDDASESCMNNITSGSCTGRYKWGGAHDGLVIHLGTGNLNELSDINLTLSGNPSPMDIDKWRVLKNEPDCLKASGVSGSAHGDATNREDKDECWQYVSVTEDSLASALAEGATTMVLNDSSKFPSSGTLQIGSEYVHFTSNDLTTNTITLSIRGSRPSGILAENIPANGMGGDWTTQTLTGDNLLTGFQGGYVEIGGEIFEIDYGNNFSNLDNKTIIFKSRGQRGSSMSSHDAGASVKNYDMRDQGWPVGTAVYEGPPNSVPIVMAKTGSGDNENYPRKRLKKKVTLNFIIIISMSIKFKKSDGVSLVELMLGLFIASFNINFLCTLCMGSGLRSFYQVSDTSELQDEAIIIFSMIEKDIARGGFVHPIRGDITNEDNCISVIDEDDAVNIVSGSEISACYDKPNYDGTTAYRYKITFKKGNGSAGLENVNTLYKKIERTNDCTGTDTVDTSSEPNFTSTTHTWQPISKNINTINFTKAVINTNTKEDIVNVDINFSSINNDEYNFDFTKRIFLRNRSVTSNAGRCDNRCPNSKKIFSDYAMSDNTTFWNPADQIIPSARIIIEDGYDSTEDELKWDTDLATAYSLTANFNAGTGVLSITGNADGDEYENFIQNVTYVNSETDPDNRNDTNDPDRRLILALGSNVCSPVPREVGVNTHFYCYQTRTSGGSSSWSPGSMSSNNWYWWGEAEAEAEGSRYFNLRGYLATITNSEENEYIKERIRRPNNDIPAGWIGGSDIQTEGTWRWMGGPEDGQTFFSDDGNCNNDSWVIPWAGDCASDEPNNNTGAQWWSSEASRGTNAGYSCAMGTGQCCGRTNGMTDDTVCDGEHYAQYKSDGDWNDLFLPGYNTGVYVTDGYVLEFSTNFVSTNTCGNGNADQRAACANYLLSKEIVVKDFTYQDEDMLDLCDINP